MENTFYIARFADGKIDRKINLTQRDLTLAFVNGRFSGYGVGDIRIFKIDLDSVMTQEIPVSDILERIQENRVKREKEKERRKKREIEKEIERLQARLKN